jgi:hypothetical protein
MYLLSQENFTQQDIGFILGGWDRTTVRDNASTIKARACVEPGVKNDIQTISKKLSTTQ